MFLLVVIFAMVAINAGGKNEEYGQHVWSENMV